VGINRFSS